MTPDVPDCVQHACPVFRVARPRNYDSALLALGLVGDEALQILDWLQKGTAISGSAIDEIFEGPFRRRNSGGTTAFTQSRFSDGTFPVTYTGAEIETACEEKLYHHARNAPGLRGYFAICSAEFEGVVVDLRPLVSLYPALVHGTDYSFCQAMGRRVSAQRATERIDAMLAQSARRPNGTNVPVFAPTSLTKRVAVKEVIFEPPEGSASDWSIVLVPE